jgi:hypothetical protein
VPVPVRPVLAAAVLLGCLVSCGERPGSPRHSSTAGFATGAPSASAATTLPATVAPTAGAPSGSPGPWYTFQVTLSGSDALQGSLRVPAGAGGCGLPSGFTGAIAGREVRFAINNRSEPTGQSAPLSPGDITLQVGGDTWNVGSSANAPQGTTGALQHGAAGSGRAGFANLYLVSNPMHTPQESGTISWSCA